MIISKPLLASAAAATWQPTRIQLDSSFRDDDDPSVTVVSTVRTSFGATAVAPEMIFNAWRGSTLLARETIAGRASRDERAAAAGIRDALLASDFLRRATVVTSIPALPLDHVRLTVTDAAGVGRAVTLPAGSELLSAVDQACERYFAAAFPELVGAAR